MRDSWPHTNLEKRTCAAKTGQVRIETKPTCQLRRVEGRTRPLEKMQCHRVDELVSGTKHQRHVKTNWLLSNSSHPRLSLGEALPARHSRCGLVHYRELDSGVTYDFEPSPFSDFLRCPCLIVSAVHATGDGLATMAWPKSRRQIVGVRLADELAC